MMLRVLLAVLLFVTVGLGGCKKEEPKTLGDQVDQMKKDAEKAADEVQDEAQDVADEAEEMADEAAEAAEN